MEKAIEIKSCKNCGTQFEITDKDLEFYDNISPVFGGRKYGIPSPTLCPDCRQQRRLAWRNERKLYHRKSDLSGKQLISIYSPDKNVIVYGYEERWSDQWNPLDYGKAFDFNKSFFEQFVELYNKIPHCNLSTIGNANSDYTNITGYSKDCYMSFLGDYNENMLYTYIMLRAKDSVDCQQITDSNNCYNSIIVSGSSFIFDSKNIHDGYSIYGSQNLQSCRYCINCSNLVNKEYCVNNESVGKEKFEILLKNYQRKDLQPIPIQKYCLGTGSENCSGDELVNSNNLRYCFDMTLSQDCDYQMCGYGLNSSHSGDNNCDGSWFYETSGSGVSSSNLYFSIMSWENLHNIFYSAYCFNSSNLFGCIGLRNKSYCILNKQYPKDEYEKLVPQIIEHMQKSGEWGEFFPIEVSPFGYNETAAQELIPLSKDDILLKGWNYSDYENQNGYNGNYYIPLDINEYNKDENKIEILKGVLKCEISGKPYRVIKPELEFYIKHNIQIPKRSPDQRHLERMSKRNPRKLRTRECDCPECANNNGLDKTVTLQTTYSPDRPEKVYCETCYNKEVYG